MESFCWDWLDFIEKLPGSLDRSFESPSTGSGPFLRFFKQSDISLWPKALSKKRAYIGVGPFRVEMAEGPGFEPGLTGPEPVVLPLDDPPVFCKLVYYRIKLSASRKI